MGTPEQLETFIEISVMKALEKFSNKKKQTLSKEYYTRKELSELFNCSLSTVYNWTVAGKLTAYGIGNRVLYRADEVHESLIKL